MRHTSQTVSYTHLDVYKRQTLDEMLAKVGDTSAKVKNQLWVLAGAAEDGSIRSGSMLDLSLIHI